MQLTKTDLSRVIVQALYGMKDLPAADHFKVTRMAKTKKDHLERQHKLAVKVLQDRLARQSEA